MKKFLFIIMVFHLTLGCNDPNTDNNTTSTKEQTSKSSIEFERYVATLEKLTLPIQIETNSLGPEFSDKYDEEKFEKYKHANTSVPLGIYFQKNGVVGIIDCGVGDLGYLPFLTTFDQEGNKIDSIRFFNKYGIDMGYEGSEYITFYPDQKIEVLDTIKTWDLNEDQSNIVEGTMKISAGKTNYKVLENGKIIKN